MKKWLMLLLIICIFISTKIINAQQITGSPAEKKMSAMLLKKIRQFERDAAIKKVNIANYKNKYGSKFIPVDGNGRMFLSITTIRNIDVVANTITSWGGIIHNKGTNILYAWVPMDKLSVLSRIDGITIIDGPGYSYARTGSVTTAGDLQLLADSARILFYTNGADINGIPVNVGVISDGMQYYTNSQQTGDLPMSNFGWINYNGISATSFIGTEGTAIMEIVHDLAPGAGLYFGGVGRYINSNNDTLSTTPLDMANAISTLSTSSNCKVIVDDIGWFIGTPWFEDWEISQAIYNFQSNGGTYVSAAGNDAENMYSGRPSIKTGGIKNWAQFNGSDTTLTFTINNYKSFLIVLQWDDAWGNSPDDYNLWLYDSNWNLIDSSNTFQQGVGYYPEEWLAHEFSNYLNNSTFHIMVDYKNYYIGRTLKNIKVLVNPEDEKPNGTPSFTFTDGSSTGHIYGHSAATGVISVAAYDAGSPNSVESFSSRGPSLMFTSGNPANEQNRNTPVITATDGVDTKVGIDGHFGNPFSGTSAAAPHVAAIAALYYSRYPTQSSSQLTTAITSSAKSIGGGTGSTWNLTSGFGKINAYDALVKGLTILNSPQVTSNTSWDLDNITGTASIAAGVTVTIDANYTTLIDGTVNLSDANSKILVYGTLILSNTASINPASGLIVEPGGRIFSPNMVTVSVNQLDENSIPFGTVGHWTFNKFDSTNVPYTFPSFAGTPERMRGSQYFKTGTTQKFHLWNGNNARIVNPDTFKTAVGQPNIITSQFKTANDATIQESLEGVIPSGTLNFLDPWMIDTTDTYGPRNQGMSDWHRPVSYSSNNLGTGTSHMGVFLNENQAFDPLKPNYSVKALSPQDINLGGSLGIHKFYFQNWSGTGVTYKNPNSLQTAVVFDSSNATAQAVMKGTQLSSQTDAIAGNGQRKIVKTPNGYLHQVYESLGKVWYERSTDNGQTWQIMNGGQPVSVGTAKQPSIDYRNTADGPVIAIVYQSYTTSSANVNLSVFKDGVLQGNTYGFGVYNVSQNLPNPRLRIS